MKKITVIGCTGSGKTYFGEKLSAKLNIPLHTIDAIYFGKNWTKLSQEDLKNRLKEIMQTKTWIIDGQFTKHIPLRLKEVDTVFFFDLPKRTVLYRIIKRYIRLRLKKESLPHDSTPKFPWHNIKLMLNFPKKEVYDMLNKVPENIKVIVFRRTKEVKVFLNTL